MNNLHIFATDKIFKLLMSYSQFIFFVTLQIGPKGYSLVPGQPFQHSSLGPFVSDEENEVLYIGSLML